MPDAIRWDLLANVGKNFNDAYEKGQTAAAQEALGSELASPNPDYGRLASLATRIGQPQLALGLFGTMATQRADAQAQRDYSGGGTSAPSGGGQATPLVTTDPVSQSLPPHQKALLNAISGPESGGAYNVRYTPQGGAPFDENGQHPGVFEPGPAGPSSAAGRYQFTKTTWDSLTGGAPFTRENQDAAAIQLAKSEYQRKTGRDLDADLQQNGLTPQIASTLAPTWAGLGDNPGKAIAQYGASLSRYQKGGAAPVQVAGPGAPAVPPQARPGSTPPDPETTGTGAPAPAAPGGVVIPPEAQRLQALARRPNLSPALSKQFSDQADLIIKKANEAPHIVKTNDGVYRMSPYGGEPQLAIQDKKETTTIPRSEYARHGFSPSDPRIVQLDSEGNYKFPDPTTNQEYADRLKKYNDNFEEIRKAEETARGSRTTIGFMRKLVDSPDLYTGTANQAVTTLRRAAASFGITDVKDAATNEIFEKFAKRLTYDTSGGSFSSGFSNGDRQFVDRMNAGPDFSKEGNRRILDAVDKIEARKMEVAKMARLYAKGHGGRIDADFYDQLSNWSEQNPVFPQTQEPGAAPAPAAPPLDVNGTRDLGGGITLRRTK